MVEELLSYWSSWQQHGSATDCGWLPFIDVPVLLTKWSYLSHYPQDLKPSKLPCSSMLNTEEDQTDTHTSCTYAPGQGITADVDLFRTSMSKDEQDQVDHGDSSAKNISSTSSCISCVTPASCVFLKSEGPPSKSHLVQVCILYVCL